MADFLRTYKRQQVKVSQSRSVAFASISVVMGLSLIGCASGVDSQDASSSSSTLPASPLSDGFAFKPCEVLSPEDVHRTIGGSWKVDIDKPDLGMCDYSNGSNIVSIQFDKNGSYHSTAQKNGKRKGNVPAVAGAQRVDSVVFLRKQGGYIAIGTGLVGFEADDIDVVEVEKLAKVAAKNLEKITK
ncbi:hypothetical protein [Streptomyces sp. NPDC007355]|uniref:hypothetical protein n=1 Tax=Streptomyces sp. NPDC007355 TaxID=3364778 RepID=UPI0036B0F631